MRIVTKRLRWMAAGAALGWFYDPARGDERRARARMILSTATRRTLRTAEGLAGWLPSRARMRVAALLARVPGSSRGADDLLRRHIERDVLRAAGASELVVEVHSGRVVVHGAVANVETVGTLADRIHRVPEVVSVDFRV